MKESILGQILALKDLPTKELQEKYQALFDDKKAPSGNRVYLWKKIAYRIQELEYGSISQDAQNRINELKKEYDPINNKAIRPEKSSDAKPNQYRSIRDRRLPIPGTIIKKEYKGTIIQVAELVPAEPFLVHEHLTMPEGWPIEPKCLRKTKETSL